MRAHKVLLVNVDQQEILDHQVKMVILVCLVRWVQEVLRVMKVLWVRQVHLVLQVFRVYLVHQAHLVSPVIQDRWVALDQ